MKMLTKQNKQKRRKKKIGPFVGNTPCCDL